MEATQHENKINHLEKKIDIDSVKKTHKEFVKNNKLILKTQQRFKSERYNVFTEETNKIALIVRLLRWWNLQIVIRSWNFAWILDRHAGFEKCPRAIFSDHRMPIYEHAQLCAAEPYGQNSDFVKYGHIIYHSNWN